MEGIRAEPRAMRGRVTRRPDAREAQTGREPAPRRRFVSRIFRHGLSSAELVKLHHSLLSQVSGGQGIITQFVGPDPDPAVRDVVYDLAFLTADWLGKRVLFVDGTTMTEDPPQNVWAGRRKHRREPALDALGPSGRHDNTISRVAGLELYVMTFPNMQSALDPVPEIRRIPDFLEQLRDNFEMVLVAAPPASSAPMAMLLSRFVDGNVLVLQSGRTRAPVAAGLRDSLRTAGGSVVGAVLTQCRSFVPRFLRRWM